MNRVEAWKEFMAAGASRATVAAAWARVKPGEALVYWAAPPAISAAEPPGWLRALVREVFAGARFHLQRDVATKWLRWLAVKPPVPERDNEHARNLRMLSGRGRPAW